MAQVTIGATNYDAFTTVAFADSWLGADILRASSWALRNNDTKGRGLVSATRYLLSNVPWCDTPPDPTGDTVPDVVQQVTAMLASDLAAKPKLQGGAGGGSNIKIAKAGSAMVEFFSPVDGGPPLPPELWGLLDAAGLVCGYGNAGDGSMEGAYVSGASECRPLFGRYPWDWPIAEEDYL